MSEPVLDFYTVCPFHSASFGLRGQLQSRVAFREQLGAHARWAEEHGMRGMVFYNFGESLDAWTMATLTASTTERLRPVVTLLSGQMDPCAVARGLLSMHYLFGRAADLNLVIGAERGRMASDSDRATMHARLVEEVAAIREAMRGHAFEGAFYRFGELALPISPDPAAEPRVFVPGSSDRSRAVVVAAADSTLLMAKPLEAMQAELVGFTGERDLPPLQHCIIVGVVARATRGGAWVAANELFPRDARDKMASRVFVARAHSSQHRANLEFAREASVHDELLWYGASKVGIDCPKLVGSYQEVAAALLRYSALGVRAYVLDLPNQIEEYAHVERVLEIVRGQSRPRGCLSAGGPRP